jgi:hypothetical protein
LRESGSLRDVPTSVPDLYFDYLRRLIPSDNSAEDAEAALDACQRLAVAALEPDFLPKEFTLKRARSVLGSENSDAVQLFLANGVLTKRDVGSDAILRFALDPIAEYLAAFAHARSASGEAKEWKRLVHEVEDQDRAKGFALALKLTW